MKDLTKKNWNLENDEFRRKRRNRLLLIAAVRILLVIIITLIALFSGKKTQETAKTKSLPTAEKQATQYRVIPLKLPPVSS